MAIIAAKRANSAWRSMELLIFYWRQGQVFEICTLKIAGGHTKQAWRDASLCVILYWRQGQVFEICTLKLAGRHTKQA